jgi:hypothetical protein
MVPETIAELMAFIQETCRQYEFKFYTKSKKNKTKNYKNLYANKINFNTFLIIKHRHISSSTELSVNNIPAKTNRRLFKDEEKE